MIEVQDLNKTFRVHQKAAGIKGSVRSLFARKWVEKHALQGMNLKVGEGEIVGLIGANGAGKTTLVKILAGIIHPSAGEVRVLGHKPFDRHNDFRRQIALIMGQKAQLWWDLPAGDCFLLLREIYRIPPKQFDDTLDFLTMTLDVKSIMTTQIRRLSLGERMKMELIASLLHKPRVVFFDEPTIGLDLTAQQAIRQFILNYRSVNRPAMILTSHYMEDIERLCERIVIVRQGAAIYDGPLRQVVEKYARHKVVTLTLAAKSPYVIGDDVAKHISGFKDGAAQVIETTDTMLKVKVLRAKVADTAAALLKAVPTIDLAIDEEDIGVVIEAIMTGRVS